MEDEELQVADISFIMKEREHKLSVLYTLLSTDLNRKDDALKTEEELLE